MPGQSFEGPKIKITKNIDGAIDNSDQNKALLFAGVLAALLVVGTVLTLH